MRRRDNPCRPGPSASLNSRRCWIRRGPNMTRASDNVGGVRHLLAQGETTARALETLPAGLRLGLWAPSGDGKRQVATAALVRLWAALGGDVAETVAAVCACEDPIRPTWLSVLAARLAEMGRRRDAAEL